MTMLFVVNQYRISNKQILHVRKFPHEDLRCPGILQRIHKSHHPRCQCAINKIEISQKLSGCHWALRGCLLRRRCKMSICGFHRSCVSCSSCFPELSRAHGQENQNSCVDSKMLMPGFCKIFTRMGVWTRLRIQPPIQVSILKISNA